MKRLYLASGAVLGLSTAWAGALAGPQSLLPPGFEDPAPAPSPTPRATPRTVPKAMPSPRASASAAPSTAPSPASTVSVPVIQALPGTSQDVGNSLDAGTETRKGKLSRIPSLDELSRMTPEDFEALLTDHKGNDIPPGARRSLARLGLIDESEGGIDPGSFATQNPRLVTLALEANRGRMVSRWGHILVRRALASRLPAPRDMEPQAFLARRVALLLRMGETDAARAVLQDIDSGNYTPAIDGIALDVYLGAGDLTGICPAMPTQGAERDDAPWRLAKSICNAYRGNSAAAMAQLKREQRKGDLASIDYLLAQKYAGAAGSSRRAVTIEWEGVDELTPWRFGLSNATGLEPPEALMARGGTRYRYQTVLSPAASLARRAAAADLAAGTGVLSSAAMVDLYGQLYADPEAEGKWAEAAEALRNAYVAPTMDARLSAIDTLWGGGEGNGARYGRQVLTAYAAARLAPGSASGEQAAKLIASMLAAGLDANAVRWSGSVEAGDEGWALLALASQAEPALDTAALDRFAEAEPRKAALLIAGLAALGRIEPSVAGEYSDRMNLKLAEATRWTSTIDSTSRNRDVATTVLLAGFGMQGSSWQQMTPRALFHIVAALSRVGLRDEARMIAAEAVARS
jgi:hypothetical protein